MLYLSGIIITCFLCILLFTKKEKSKADILLSIWLLVTGIHLTLYYIFITGRYIHSPVLLGIEMPLPLAQGPFLLLYTAALTNFRIKPIYSLLHFLPIAIIYLFMIPFFGLPNAEKIMVYQNKGAGYESITFTVMLLIMFSGIIYVILSLLLLRRHKKMISQQFSYSEKISLNWLRFLIFGTAAIWICVIFGNDFLIYTFAVFYVILIGYFGIRQEGIFTARNLYHQESHPVDIPSAAENMLQEFISDRTIPEKSKYQKSGLSNPAALEIHKQLTALMQQEKLFKSPELTLPELAERLHTHPNNLSQVINTFEEKNFYDYINLQRVEEFKRLIIDDENKQYTMLSIAFECGFNSKTSFNRNFKKVTGLAPSEFLRLNSINPH